MNLIFEKLKLNNDMDYPGLTNIINGMATHRILELSLIDLYSVVQLNVTVEHDREHRNSNEIRL